MKRSTPSSSVIPATGTVPREESVAASVMKPPPVTAAAPFEVSMSTSNKRELLASGERRVGRLRHEKRGDRRDKSPCHRG